MKRRISIALLVVAVVLIVILLAVRNRPNLGGRAPASKESTAMSSSDSAPLADPRKTEAERQTLATPKPMFVPMARWGEAPIRLLVVEREGQRPIPGASVSFI